MPLKVLLTDKEIEKLLGIEFRNTYSGYVADYLAVRDAQLRKVVGWLGKECDEHPRVSDSYGIPYFDSRTECMDCQQALKKEAGG